MSSATETVDKSWDFGPVIDLLNTLSSPQRPVNDATKHERSPLAVRAHTDTPRVATYESTGLGDFSKIWEFMGVSPNTPPPRIKQPTIALLDPLSNNGSLQFEEAPFKEEPSKRISVELNGAVDYTSDGAVYTTPKFHSVRWRDQPEYIENTDTDQPASIDSADDPTNDESTEPTTRLTKKQRNKANRRARREAEAEELRRQQSKAVSDAEMESTSKVRRNTPARKASIHPSTPDLKAAATPVSRYNLRSRGPATERGREERTLEDALDVTAGASKRKAKDQASKKQKPVRPVSDAGPASAPKTPDAKSTATIDFAKQKEPSLDPKTPSHEPKASSGEPKTPANMPETSSKVAKTSAVAPKTPANAPTAPVGSMTEPTPNNVQHTSSNHPQTTVKARPLVPMNVAAFDQSPLAKQTTYQTKVAVHVNATGPNGPVHTDVSFSQVRQAISHLRPQWPFVMRYGEDRHFHFLLELHREFPNDRKWLLSPAQLAHHVSAENGGIHVFVDASNIFVGFKDYMRRLYNLPVGQQVKDLNISFDSLVLLMERRRPVAKRVLAGSYPHLPAFDMAKAVGYETNLLDQVYKDHQLSKSQKRQFYTRRTSFGQGAPGGGGYASGEVAGSGMTSVITAGAGSSPTWDSSNTQKWVEQGVDEILHLKMLESIVDMDVPSTMVLATGDAAVAEYSSGFLKMVERALKKGWKVELLSWTEGINKAYLNPRFRQTWGENFRVVALDAFAEDLVDS